MKNRMIKSISLVGLILVFYSCTKPRIERDDARYGDRAVITGINIVRYNEVSNQLNYDEIVTGAQTVGVINKVTIDNTNKKADVIVNKGTDLTKVAIQITNQAVRVEAQNGAPTPGYIRDFSKGPYVYRLFSSDGTVRDWTISISILP
ncbi:DUF5018-related domain-containing protein [Pedobacter frigoris]|uniref:DUF5018-related domain-containing protein n=1 Tax=Pedobacter frigoris TaxID=2571272 RepID=UPI00292D4548|nr:hypothetical protein [Pedobacter frigoris]